MAMKVRSGFVSNSSSTSFSIVVSKEDYKHVLLDLPERIREEVKKCGTPTSQAFGEQELVLVCGVVGDEQMLFGKNFQPNTERGDYSSCWSYYRSLQTIIDMLKTCPHLYYEKG
jgi:hypothetical protein